MAVDDRSMYPALRRLGAMELVEDQEHPGTRTGAGRKYYRLTESGAKVLDAFLDRHIRQVYLDGSSELFAGRSSARRDG